MRTPLSTWHTCTGGMQVQGAEAAAGRMRHASAGQAAAWQGGSCGSHPAQQLHHTCTACCKLAAALDPPRARPHLDLRAASGEAPGAHGRNLGDVPLLGAMRAHFEVKRCEGWHRPYAHTPRRPYAHLMQRHPLLELHLLGEVGVVRRAGGVPKHLDLVVGLHKRNGCRAGGVERKDERRRQQSCRQLGW